MSTLDDLNIESILDMGHDEAIEHIRQIRLNRRTPNKTIKERVNASKSRKKKEIQISANQAAELLKLLNG